MGHNMNKCTCLVIVRALCPFNDQTGSSFPAILLSKNINCFYFGGTGTLTLICMGINILEQKDLIKGHTYNKGKHNNQFSYTC